MIIQEKDIDFSKIDWKLFEEICFDLLIKYQFHSLVWRQSGSDKGRDIEAMYTVANPVVVAYQERWFVECKHHGNTGLSVTDIAEKLAWAAAEDADHLLLCTTSYLTQNTRDWLNLESQKASFRIHLLEGKQLRKVMVAFPDLVIRYFFDEQRIMVAEMLKMGVIYDILPEPKAIYSALKKVEPSKLKPDELAFLLYVFESMEERIENYCEEESLDMEKIDFIIPNLVAHPNATYPIFTIDEMRVRSLTPHYGLSTSYRKNSDLRTVHMYKKYKGKYTLEIFMQKENKRLETKIAVGLTSKHLKMQETIWAANRKLKDGLQATNRHRRSRG